MPRRGLRRGPDFWLPLIREYEESDELQPEFAARHGIELATLRDWLYRRGHKYAVTSSGGKGSAVKPVDARPAAVEPPPRLLPVRVVASAAPAPRPAVDDPQTVLVPLETGRDRLIVI